METKPRVLVVDDENSVRASFDRVLSEDGYAVNTAPDGLSALERLRSERYDLAFVDLRMPGMDGMEVVRSIRTTQPAVQVIIVTGYGTEGTAREASNLGVFEFVAKPIAPADVSDLAQRALARGKESPPAATPRHRLSDGAAGVLTQMKESPPAAAPQPEPAAAPRPEPQPLAPAAPAAEERLPLWKALGLLVRGSLLGLAYVIFLPFIGFAMLAWVLGERIYVGIRGTKAKQGT